METENVFDDDELPSSSRVIRLPRKWDLSDRERQELHEAWLLVMFEELKPFIDIPEVRQAYRAYLTYGTWVHRTVYTGEAAGSSPFETHDFDRYMRSQPRTESSVED